MCGAFVHTVREENPTIKYNFLAHSCTARVDASLQYCHSSADITQDLQKYCQSTYRVDRMLQILALKVLSNEN
jgi:hypothetical protein